jgi:hypothetical protein
LTTGNVSHLGATIRGKAIRSAEFLEKHKDESIGDNYNPYKATIESISQMCAKYGTFADDRANDFANNIRVKCKDAVEYDKMYGTAQTR